MSVIASRRRPSRSASQPRPCRVLAFKGYTCLLASSSAVSDLQSMLRVCENGLLCDDSIEPSSPQLHLPRFDVHTAR